MFWKKNAEKVNAKSPTEREKLKSQMRKGIPQHNGSRRRKEGMESTVQAGLACDGRKDSLH